MIALMPHHLGAVIHAGCRRRQLLEGMSLGHGSAKRRHGKRQRDQQSQDGAQQEQFSILHGRFDIDTRERSRHD